MVIMRIGVILPNPKDLDMEIPSGGGEDGDWEVSYGYFEEDIVKSLDMGFFSDAVDKMYDFGDFS